MVTPKNKIQAFTVIKAETEIGNINASRFAKLVLYLKK